MTDLGEAITSVDEHDNLLRRVINREDFLEWHDDLGRWIPSSAALTFDPDGMSVFIQSILLAHNWGIGVVSSLGGSKPQELTFSTSVQTTRNLGFRVDASPNDETPIGAAHGSVIRPANDTRPEFKTRRTDLATQMICVDGQTNLPKPQGA